MIEFTPHPLIASSDAEYDPAKHKATYRYPYEELFRDIADNKIDELGTYRTIILSDLWFIVNFILEIPGANNPFVVEACQEVEHGPDGWCLDLWSRFHFKSSIKTKARTIQRILKYPEKCTMIASYARKAAKKFVVPVAKVLETNELLKQCFPDVLYGDPRKESEKWSEDEGYIVKRKSKSRSEATLEAHGVKEGMPTGSHFDWIQLDDLETRADVKNPDVIQSGRDAVDLCLFLLTGEVAGADGQVEIKGGSVDITGTPYSHTGIYIPHILDKVNAKGEPKFLYRRKPGTEDGTRHGKPVMMTQEALDDTWADLSKDMYGEYNFYCQVLIDPTPKGTQELNSTLMMNIEPEHIPKNLIKFMVIDPAGDDAENKNKGDDWGIWVVGVEPKPNEVGIHKRYILDGFLDVLTSSAAPELLGRMFMGKNIRQSGYEYKSIDPAWVQNWCSFVRKSGGTLYDDTKMNMIVRLKDGGRQKLGRIVSAISRPLNNACLYISTAVPDLYNRKLREEMDKLGFWPDNGVDSLAYLDDLLRTFDFNIFQQDITKDTHKLDEKNNEYGVRRT